MYYLKKSLPYFAFLIFTMITETSVLLVDTYALQLVLSIANLTVYCAMLCLNSHRDGQTALKIRNMNDSERAQMIRTGQDRPLRLSEEYKFHKGFVLGAVISVPIVICAILHFIFMGIENDIFGIALQYLGMPVYGIMTLALHANASYLWGLMVIPVNVVCVGIAYNLGAKKLIKQAEFVERLKKDIEAKK